MFDVDTWIARLRSHELVLREPDDFDTVIRAVETISQEWASENPFWVSDWYPLYTLIEPLRGVPFDQFALYLEGGDEAFIFYPVGRLWQSTGLTAEDMLSADSDRQLGQVTAEEVVLGFARLASLAETGRGCAD